MSNIRFLGIYEEEIDKAVNLSELAMEREGFTEKEISEMNDMVIEQLEECGDWSNITNSIIDAYFTVTADLIKQRRKGAEVSYYVNGMDSHFYINGEEKYVVINNSYMYYNFCNCICM